MSIDILMPALSPTMTEGKLSRWLVKEGDTVKSGNVLCEIETDKAVVEVEAPADGILAGIKASAGEDIPVGQTIAWIVAPGEAVPIATESSAPAARAGSHAKAEITQVVAAQASSNTPVVAIRIGSTSPARERCIATPANLP